MSCDVNDVASRELVGQEAFVQPVLALCETRGKKLSWSHSFAIEAGPDSSAPEALSVPKLPPDLKGRGLMVKGCVGVTGGIGTEGEERP